MAKESFSWNGLPDRYSDNIRSQAFIGEELIQTISFRPDDDVLDAGCGVGNLTLAIARRVPEGSVTGMDISEKRLEECRELFSRESVPNARFYASRIEEMTEKDTYTVVFSNSVLQWISDMDLACRKFCECLKPGGLAALQFPRLNERHPMIAYPERAIRELQLEEYFEGWRFPACVPSEEEMKSAMQDAGFEDIRVGSDTTSFSFPTAEALFRHFNNVGYARYLSRVPEERKEEFLRKIRQDIEEDYREEKTQWCDRWFVYGRKPNGRKEKTT